MKNHRPRFASLLAGSLVLTVLSANAQTSRLPDPLAPTGRWSIEEIGNAATPPMGWSSWNAFRTDINEEKVLAAAEAIKREGLAELGYRYINIDDGWWLKRRQSDGRMLIRTNLFPSARGRGKADSSFLPFTTRIHQMGLKAGIYTDIGRNACSQAFDLTSPNLPEGGTAEREVGAFGHVEQDVALYFEEWGFDYIKVDACGLADYGPAREIVAQYEYRPFEPYIVRSKPNRSNIDAVTQLYGAMRSALVRSNPDRDFVFSICAWGEANSRSWGKNVGNLWRTSGDITPEWSRMLHTFDSAVTRELYAGPGRWNDPDMLFVGHGDFDEKHLLQARSHFALWSIIAAPLIIGYDLRNAPQALLDIWSAKEIIAVNQDTAGNQGVLAYSGDDVQIIVKTLSTRGEKAVALFNRSSSPTTVYLTAEHLKMRSDKPIALRDLWAGKDLPAFVGERSFQIAAHETVMLKATGPSILSNGQYLSEMPARINVAVDGIRALQNDPTIHHMVDPWTSTRTSGTRPQYAGWGGPRADATPYDEALSIRDSEYRSGIGALAGSRLEVKADRAFTRFSADVGIDDSSLGTSVPVTFEVYGDGRLLARSLPKSFGDRAESISADVRNVSLVELVARPSGQDPSLVVVTWGNAAFEVSGPAS
ncbi:MAG TPA: NPCBM/NEW2 domain-containing protein [Steroidobacter sp.]|uniref:NPCBM/NEW2 domain-containing protein n=1 Tax=Steroidobacter sp. TaxID=1978227 RepID=UPI002ED85E6F